MSIQTKVVRVEDVEAGEKYTDVVGYRKVSAIDSTHPVHAEYIGSEHSEPSGSGGTEKNDDDLELEEADDKVYPLPENWPRIKQIFRRKSCELVHTTSPCVNKAVSHLELIQNIIEEWFRERDAEIPSQASVRPVVSRKQLRFARSSDDRAKFLRSANSHVSAASRPSTTASSQTLSIKGVGVVTEEDQESIDLPYLGAEEVINEVITLLARLENDRVEAQKKLEKEKERVVRLNDRIDKLCLKRMTEMPAVVQREHEACILDLNELQWHVAYSVRNQKRIHNRTNIADVLNTRLKEDIVFVKRHIPLVEEKLELELQAMNKIKSAQTDTVSELDNTKQRQEKTESKSNEAMKKAETERTHIKKELDTVKDALTSISEELSEAKMTFNAYVHQVNDIHQQLKDNDQELQVLDVRNENAKVAEEMQARKVREIQVRITEAEFEHQRLENENLKFQQDLDAKKRMYATKIEELENIVKSQDSKLRVILLKNQESEMEVMDYQDKIADCQRQHVADGKNVSRIQKEMIKLQGQMVVTMEEFNKIQNLNTSIQEALQNEQDKAFRKEESLKTTADTLRRQVKDEVHTKTVLVARIRSDSTELTKVTGESKQKTNKDDIDENDTVMGEYRPMGNRNVLAYYGDTGGASTGSMSTGIPMPGKLLQAQIVADEVETAVNGVLQKVERLRSAKKEKSKQKQDLKTRLEDTNKQFDDSLEKFTQKVNEIEPHHSHLKNDVLALDKRLDHMAWKTEMMNKQMGDMDREQGTMDRLVNNTDKAISDLDVKLEEAKIQLEAGQKIEEDMKSDLKNNIDRLRDNDAKHRKFMEERRSFLEASEVDKVKRLRHNKEIASQYRKLQNDFMVLKDQLLNSFEERVKLENAIKDCKQLQSLQKRMHGAMYEYFKFRGLWNKSELNRMEGETKSNGVRVAELQDQMDEALKKITTFIKTQMDGGTARRFAWQASKNQQKRDVLMGKSVKEPAHIVPPNRQTSMVQA